MEDYLSMQEVCEVLKLSKQRIYQIIKNGTIRTKQESNQTIYHKDDVYREAIAREFDNLHTRPTLVQALEYARLHKEVRKSAAEIRTSHQLLETLKTTMNFSTSNFEGIYIPLPYIQRLMRIIVNNLRTLTTLTILDPLPEYDKRDVNINDNDEDFHIFIDALNHSEWTYISLMLSKTDFLNSLFKDQTTKGYEFSHQLLFNLYHLLQDTVDHLSTHTIFNINFDGMLEWLESIGLILFNLNVKEVSS